MSVEMVQILRNTKILTGHMRILLI
ncbi:hypothetical protein Gotur_021028 [Gossypium turneri]